jgi:hypothetical protein
VHKFSEAHQAHWSWLAHPEQSKYSSQLGTAGHEFFSNDHDAQGELFDGPVAVPSKHCKVDSQNPHPISSVQDGHRPTETQKSSESFDENCEQTGGFATWEIKSELAAWEITGNAPKHIAMRKIPSHGFNISIKLPNYVFELHAFLTILNY